MIIPQKNTVPQSLPFNDVNIVEIIDLAIENYRGTANELESAIGLLFVGRRYGWRPIFLMHSQSSIRKYEKIIGFKFKDIFPESSDLSDRSIAWKASKKISSFWKAVNGEIKGIKTNLLS